jgi:NitT/TauT family transport system permease protein
VGYALIESLIAGSLLRDLAMTLFRVALAFLFALVLGAAIGYAMGRSRSLDRLFDSWLTLLLNLPALVLIVLMYVWFGLNEPTAIAASYRLGRMKTLRHVILPQLSPYFFAASRSGLAIIWKIVLVVELLGRSNGVGFAIEQYFQLFDVTHILAYTLAFILVVQGIEWLVWQPWERRINRWRT